MYSKDSVSIRIAKYMFAIIVIAGVISSLSLAIMASNKFDAEAINISGSLRMQSYRLLYEMDKNPQNVEYNLQQYQKSIYSPALTQIQSQFFVPKEIKESYRRIIIRWHKMMKYAREHNVEKYSDGLISYVKEVDLFVAELQHFAERKWQIALSVLGISMLLIVGMVSYVLWYTKREVVLPLQLMTKASMQVQMRQFNHIPLNIQKNNELGVLAKTFSQMAMELGKLYSRLEDSVNEKTQKLRQTNRSLGTLYQSSQLLTTNKINDKILSQVLNYICVSEHLRYIELEVVGSEHWNVKFGEKVPGLSIKLEPLYIENEHLGTLIWQAGLPCPNPKMMKNVSQMLARTLFFYKNLRQQEQLLLMEERSIIARELHDSLAQVLSFLRIQLTLLKQSLKKEDKTEKDKSLAIIAEFEKALSSGYSQLRELLATFRLTVQEADLKLALEQVVDSLRGQTTMQIQVECHLFSQSFSPQQLVHILQIVREAVLNAIKHSKGNKIDVITRINKRNEYEILIQDDGIGISSLDEPEGHYGLNIMNERSAKLNAQLTVSRRPSGGTQVKMILPATI
ncbi:nitrate/nitrite two-component system sensor histidine kinase NarQ [Rodentibacter caecimuris]|uniref:Sensor protein n=1 Tax=Rodentibacter caecimuris TaxID=1796644 RepID=A0ABX3L176_9PAST|nr:two-component system sensor histidine kinase NarQ [Rodentibacter heylii]